MGKLLQDLRYGSRMLVRYRAVTAIAVITLALGIGANTAIFSVINAVLHRPLPFASPDRLVAVGSTQTNDRSRFGLLSYPDIADFQAQQSTFERMATYHTRGLALQSAGGIVRLESAVVTSDLLPVLGVNPLLGRAFRSEEDKAGGGRVVLLSHNLWRNRFDSDPNVVGRSLALNGQSFIVVGVMPADFQFPIQSEPVELWINFALENESTSGESQAAQRGNHYLSGIGRLKPGVTVEQAEAQLVTIAASLEKQYPNYNANFSARVRPLMENLTGVVRDSLLVIFAAVGCVLLIACANVANILLARAANRRREIALRAALGASRWRVVRQMLTESALLAMIGGAAGVMLAGFAMDVLIALNPADIPRIAESGLDSRVLLFTFATATLTGILMGLVPALQSSKLDLNTVLKDGGRGASGGSLRFSARGALVIAEVAIAVTLLIGAGLLIQSFARLMRVNPGFNPDNLLTMRISFPDGLYTTPEQIAGFHDRLMTGLQSLPGVSAYSTVAPTPLSGSNFRVGFSVQGRPNPSGRQYPYDTRLMLVGSGYFGALGIPFRQGRDYTARDGLQSAQVALINEAFAKRHFPGENPIGKRIDPSIGVGDGAPPMREIIGVVADSRSRRLGAEPEPEVYLHIPQVPSTGSLTLILRAQTEPMSLVTAARQEIMKLDRNAPIYDIKPFNEYVSDSVAQPRFNSALLGVFAGVALLLTAIGLYGVIAYSITQRTQEIGIRMALGARAGDVLKLIIGQGMTLVLIGVALGLGGAFAVTRLMKSLLFDVDATDPLTFASVAALVVLIALLACYAPARRATKVDPMIALRTE
ncbi:MAG: ABC transporter permease [Blastocatellia bacterium]